MIELFAKLRKMKTMLIDDDEFIRDSMAALFEGEDCRLATFETAEEALEVLDNQLYDIIITDYRLPGIDGLQFLEHIKDSQSQAMKILVTAYGGQAVTFKATNLGARRIVEKPFTIRTMEEALSRLIAADNKKTPTKRG